MHMKWKCIDQSSYPNRIRFSVIVSRMREREREGGGEGGLVRVEKNRGAIELVFTYLELWNGHLHSLQSYVSP